MNLTHDEKARSDAREGWTCHAQQAAPFVASSGNNRYIGIVQQSHQVLGTKITCLSNENHWVVKQTECLLTRSLSPHGISSGKLRVWVLLTHVIFLSYVSGQHVIECCLRWLIDLSSPAFDSKTRQIVINFSMPSFILIHSFFCLLISLPLPQLIFAGVFVMLVYFSHQNLLFFWIDFSQLFEITFRCQAHPVVCADPY